MWTESVQSIWTAHKGADNRAWGGQRGQERPWKADYIYGNFEGHKRLSGSARYIKAFQEQNRSSKLIMAGVENTKGAVAEEEETEETGRGQNMLSVSCQD